MIDKDRACWLADKIPAQSEYILEAAQLLRKQADEIERMRRGEFICTKCGLRQDGDYPKEAGF